MLANTQDYSVLLFDGTCNLCNAWVQFVIKHDAKSRFKFAALQSEAGQKLLTQAGIDKDYIDSLVLFENSSVYFKSDAALRIARRLCGGWSAFYLFRMLPTGFRNLVYDFIARNRYRWFGQQESCMLPTPELQSRFL